MSPPIYQKIKSSIIDHIIAGDWVTGEKIPSENIFAAQTGASRMTVNRALRELTQEGFLVRVQGLGTFVAERDPPGELLELRNIADEIRESGRSYKALLTVLQTISADERIARSMEVPPGTKIFHSIIVHKADDEAVQVEDRYVNPICAPDYLQVDFSSTTPNEHLMKVAPVSEVEHIVEAVLPKRNTLKLLEISANEPCLVLHRRTWSEGHVASTADLIHPGSKFRIGTRFDYRSGRPVSRPRT